MVGPGESLSPHVCIVKLSSTPTMLPSRIPSSVTLWGLLSTRAQYNMIIDGRGEKCLRDPVTLFTQDTSPGVTKTISAFTYMCLQCPRTRCLSNFPWALFMDDPFLLSSFPFPFLYGCFFPFSPLVSMFSWTGV